MLKTESLKPEKDAFGMMVKAVHEGREVFEIIERDDGYINAVSSTGQFSDHEDWHQIGQKAMKLVEGRVLDAGCGVGSHSLSIVKNEVLHYRLLLSFNYFRVSKRGS